MDEFSLEMAGRLVYEDYKIHGKKAALRRSGFLLTGYCDDEHHHYAGLPGAELSIVSDPHRPDSGSEHVEGCIQLAFAVAMWRPSLIAASELRRVTQLLLWHDAPEVIHGDIPDDGSRDDDAKEAQEYETLRKQVSHWVAPRHLELLNDYRAFQRHEGRLFQVTYCIDKVEAVLRALEYEHNGVIIDIRNKQTQLSEQDCRFAEEIGSYQVPDGWARHTLERIKDCAGRELTYWIMVAAFRDVRDEVPAWLLKWKSQH